MALLIALIGLALAVLDFFGLAGQCERVALCLKDRFEFARHKTDRFLVRSAFLWAIALFVVVVPVMLLGFILSSYGFYWMKVVGLLAPFLLVVVLSLPHLLGFVARVLHLLSLPPKGIVGSIGLIFAIAGVVIEIARS